MSNRNWHIQSPGDIPQEIFEIVGKNIIAANYLLRRNITTHEQAVRYLNPDIANLSDPFDLPNMDVAVQRILRALDDGESIGIWGDFDVDGQTSTAILVECLRKLDAKVDYYLPIRGKESHGIGLPTLQKFLQKGIQILITCDTGITAHEAVQYANSQLVDVIITDHHALPKDLPKAQACINPRRLPEEHPLATLSGSGTAFELMLAVCRKMNAEEIALHSIDLAALGLIADLAPLQKDARLIAQLGLRQLNNEPRNCIQEIRNAAKIYEGLLDEQTVGFTIAPRLNAYGRLGNANPLVRFLMDDDPQENKRIAQEMESVNADRRWLSNQVYQSAIEQFNRQTEIRNDPIIVLTNSTWRGGVLGLAAGRVASELNRPTILLNETEDGICSGSARSVEGFDIISAIESTSHLLNRSGGHPMAAGLSLNIENLPEFRRAINTGAMEAGFIEFEPPILEIDAELPISSITPDLFSGLQKLGPFGNGNPPLAFCLREIGIKSTKSLGRSMEHYKFILEDRDGNTLPAVWWGTSPDQIPTGSIDLVFALRENTYKGETTLQAEWIDFQPVEQKEVVATKKNLCRIIDFRGTEQPLQKAKNHFTSARYLIFQEPSPANQEDSIDRINLVENENLIFVSIPPSPQTLEKVLGTTKPDQIAIAFNSPTRVSMNNFLIHLSNHIKYAVTNREGLANLEHLAAATNARIETVQAGIDWLITSRKIRVQSMDENLLAFAIIKNTEQITEDSVDKTAAQVKINFYLEETLAYQKYLFSCSDLELTDLFNGIINNFKSNKKPKPLSHDNSFS